MRFQSVADLRHLLSQVMERSTSQCFGQDDHPHPRIARRLRHSPFGKLGAIRTVSLIYGSHCRDEASEGKQPEQRHHQHHAAVAVLDVDRMDHCEHRQALRSAYRLESDAFRSRFTYLHRSYAGPQTPLSAS